MRTHSRADPTAPNVAVIMIHGVADQKSSETVHAGVDMIQHMDRQQQQRAEKKEEEAAAKGKEPPAKDRGEYDEFEQEGLRIPVERLPKIPAAKPEEKSLENSSAENEKAPVEIQYMDKLTGGYEPTDGDTVYETQGFSTVRRQGQRAHNVHFYELFWADLSRPSSGVWQWVVDVYELTFLVAGLGAAAMRAMCCPRGGKGWNTSLWHRSGLPRLEYAFGRLHHLARLVFVYVLPLFNLGLLGIALTLATLRVPESHRCKVAAIPPALLVVGICWWLLSSKLCRPLWRWLLPGCAKPGNSAGWRHMAWLLGAVVTAVALAFSHWVLVSDRIKNYRLLVLALEEGMVVWALLGYIIRAWGQRLDDNREKEGRQEKPKGWRARLGRVRSKISGWWKQRQAGGGHEAKQEQSKDWRVRLGRLKSGISGWWKSEKTIRLTKRPRNEFYLLAIIIHCFVVTILCNQWLAKGADILGLATLQVREGLKLKEGQALPAFMSDDAFDAKVEAKLKILAGQDVLHHPELIHSSLVGVEGTGRSHEWKRGSTSPLGLDWLIDRTLVAGEWVFLAIRITWYVLFCLLAGMGVVKLLRHVQHRCWPRAGDRSWQAWRRTSYTALISICLPALVMMSLNIGVWRAALNFLPVMVGQVPPKEKVNTPLQYALYSHGPSCQCAKDVEENLLAATKHYTIKPWLLGNTTERECHAYYNLAQPWWRFLQCFMPETWRICGPTENNEVYDGPVWNSKAGSKQPAADKAPAIAASGGKDAAAPAGNADAVRKVGDGRPASESIMELLNFDGTFVPIALGLLGLGLTVMMWGLGLSIAAESLGVARRLGGLKEREKVRESWRYGSTLNVAFTCGWLVGCLIVWVVCLVVIGHLIVIVFATFGYNHGIYCPQDVMQRLPVWMQGTLEKVSDSSQLPAILVRLLGLAVIAIVAGRAKGGGLVQGLNALIDIALDVVNWMREGPLGRPPRARICGRFYSLLKHLERWGADVRGTPYDSIIIVAHSQGTVIAAETLHYLSHINKLPVDPQKTTLRLFTMGSPLRQLYARRFPHLYSWVVPVAPMEEGRISPDPAALGLATWWNAYRSGDYVGRGMWWSDFETPHGHSPAAVFDPASAPPDLKENHADFCIGAGAHTHYWDDTAGLIAAALDTLIAATPPKVPQASAPPSPDTEVPPGSD